MQILDIASFLPSVVVDNQQLGRLTGLAAGYFQQRTGILERRRAADGENTNTLAVRAATALLARHPQAVAAIDLIIGCSYTSWDLIGTIAHAVQRACGLVRARAFTLSSACSSVSNALEVCAAFFDAGRSQQVLVVAADHNSLYSDDTDRQSGHLWGDGAAALLLTRTAAPSAQFELLDVWTAGLGHVGLGPAAVGLMPRGAGLVMPHGRDVFVQAVEGMTVAAQTVLERNGVRAADLRLLAPHQANQRILDQVAKRLGLGPTQVASTIARYGNTGCASAVITLAEHQAQCAAGELALLVTFGGGYSSGAALLRRL